MGEPVITADFEFGFQHGATQYVTAVEGRDGLELKDGKLVILLHPDEHTTEEVTINLSALAYLRKVVRVTPAGASQPAEAREDAPTVTICY